MSDSSSKLRQCTRIAAGSDVRKFSMLPEINKPYRALIQAAEHAPRILSRDPVSLFTGCIAYPVIFLTVRAINPCSG